MKKIKGLLYCTKAKPYIMKYKDGKYKEIASFYNKQDLIDCELLNGTIPCECEIEVEEIEKIYGNNHACFDKDGYFDDYADYVTKSIEEIELLKHSCLTSDELENYLQDKNGYALHISNLKIFDEPRKLSNYHISYFNKEFNMMREKHIEKAPQNMMNVYDIKGNHYILISIQPQWLCKILNGEKTIEIKKQVLNCMKEKM